jgi:hypothetical protein
MILPVGAGSCCDTPAEPAARDAIEAAAASAIPDRLRKTIMPRLRFATTETYRSQLNRALIATTIERKAATQTSARKPSHFTSNAHYPREGVGPERCLTTGRKSRSRP